MKVLERVEQGSGRVVSPAKLTANVALKNSSANQTVRSWMDFPAEALKAKKLKEDPSALTDVMAERGQSSHCEVVMSGGEVIARCQGCGTELQDPTQRFCGGDRCLLVLMRCPRPEGAPDARPDSRFFT